MWAKWNEGKLWMINRVYKGVHTARDVPWQSPGSSLWSRCDTFQMQDKLIATPKQVHPQLSTPLPSTHNSHPGSHPTSLHSPPHQAGSRCSQESEILTSLAIIEVEVGTLYHEALNSRACIGKPSSSGLPSVRGLQHHQTSRWKE